MRLTRREMIRGGATALGAGLASLWGLRPSAAAPSGFEFTLTDTQWRKRLTAQQYSVLRKGATERAGTSPLDREKRKGMFVCAGCALPLYSSKAKFDSGTGWPSFFQPLAGSVRTRPDNSLSMKRTEVVCRRCGGHLGHVFSDGPRADGTSLLHERRGDAVRAGLSRNLKLPAGISAVGRRAG